jgi:hypothetical protein
MASSFWRSRRNQRRARRAELLRVKANSTSRKVWVLRVLTALGLAVVGTLALHYGFRSWTSLRDGVFLSPKFFGLRSITVNTNLVWLTPTEVIHWTGVSLGDNLLALDLDRIRRDLELVPQVEEAALERVLPDLLRIHVRERQPLARIRGVATEVGQLRPTTYFLDAHARVMPPLVAGRPDLETAYASLPVIAGLGSHGLRVGGELGSPGVRAALELVRVFPYSAMSGQTCLLTVDVADPEVLQVTTREGAEITLPLTQVEWQLHRWRLVHEAAARLGRQLHWLDLSMTNNCPALWQPDPPEPPAAPLPGELTQLKQRHV